VGGLIADLHGNAIFPVEQFFDPRHQELIPSSKPFRPTAGIESGPCREQPALRITNGRKSPGEGRPPMRPQLPRNQRRAAPSSRTSCPTGQPVQSTRTGRTPLTWSRVPIRGFGGRPWVGAINQRGTRETRAGALSVASWQLTLRKTTGSPRRFHHVDDLAGHFVDGHLGAGR
jgi:hypothetical protein